MAKTKLLLSKLGEGLVAELNRRLTELQEGKGDWNDFWRWWDEHFAIKGVTISPVKGKKNLSLLKERELVRGWNNSQKRSRKKSS